MKSLHSMRILQVIGSLAPRYGGPSTACPALCRALAQAGHEVVIYTTNAGMERPGDAPLGCAVHKDGYEVRYFSAWPHPRKFKISMDILVSLREGVSGFDAVHVYSYYDFCVWAAARGCWQRGVPYLLHPHGSLDPFLLRRHTIRKRVYAHAVGNRCWRRAAGVLFNSEEERRLTLGHESSNSDSHSPKSFVVPVGIEPEWFLEPDPCSEERVRQMLSGSPERENIVFLGRVDFKKGLDLLVRAFAELARGRPRAHLVIAGPETPGYGAKVRRWLDREKMLHRATFVGPLQGRERVALLRQARMLTLLSYSENFGQVVAEAMAARVPVVISDKVNIWREIEAARAGIVVPCDPGRAANAIGSLLDDPAGAAQMGERGRHWAERNWTWPIVAEQMGRVYASLSCSTYRVHGSAVKISPERDPRKNSQLPRAVASSTVDQRAAQVEFYREAVNPEEEITRPRCYPRPVQFLLDYKISTAWALLRNGRNNRSGHASALANESVLVVCCGSGMEAEMVARTGRRVVALDISAEAVARARERATRFGFPLETMVGDAEHLPFADNTFDYVFVHDGLHHLPDAYRGVREMFRVARRAVIIAEPADAAITHLSVRLGLSGVYEEAGNFVYRLDPAKLAAVFRDVGASRWRMRRSLIYYQPWTFRFYRWLEPRPLSALFRAAFFACNFAIGRWGNSLRGVAWKNSTQGELSE